MAKGKKITEGLGGSPGIVVAKVRVVDKDWEKMEKLEHGEVMVAERLTPEDTIYMKKAAAFVTDVGGYTAHAVVIGREMGVPVIVGTAEGTKVLKDGEMVVVDGFTGTTERGLPIGAVYEYVEEVPVLSLTDKMEKLAKERGIPIPPGVLEKMRKREEM